LVLSHCFSARHTLHVFLCYSFFCIVLLFFFLCVSFSFLFERRQGRRHLEGGTCDRVTCPRPRDLSVDTSLYVVRPSSALPPASPSQRPAQGTSPHSTCKQEDGGVEDDRGQRKGEVSVSRRDNRKVGAMSRISRSGELSRLHGFGGSSKH